MYPTLLDYCLLLNLFVTSLPLLVQPHLGVLCAWWTTHTMAVLHHGMVCIIGLVHFYTDLFFTITCLPIVTL